MKGEGFAFDGTEQGRCIGSFRDGSSNTIMIVQSNDTAALPWTKPQDYEPSEKAPLLGLANGPHPSVFQAGFADGHVQIISNDIDAPTFYKLLTIAGRELVNID